MAEGKSASIAQLAGSVAARSKTHSQVGHGAIGHIRTEPADRAVKAHGLGDTVQNGPDKVAHVGDDVLDFSMNRPKRYYGNMTPERAAEIRRLYFERYGTITQREIGERYGMPQGSVSRIISNQVWDRAR